MSSIIYHFSSHSPAANKSLKERLSSALAAYASCPDDVWVSASCCFDAISASLDFVMIHYDLKGSELETVMDCMDSAIQDFEHPCDFAADLAAALYFFVELAAKDLDLQLPPRFRETIYYAAVRAIARDADLLPFQMWRLIHALHDAAPDQLGRRGGRLLGRHPFPIPRSVSGGRRPRYHHEPDHHFLDSSEDEDDEADEADKADKADKASTTGRFEVKSAYDPAIPLDSVLWSTNDARRRLARLIEREQAQRQQTSPLDENASLLGDRIAFTQRHLAWLETWNDDIRKERSQYLN